MPSPQDGQAVVLADSTESGQATAATFSLNAGGTIGVQNPRNLSNPLRQPIRVDEILFNVIDSAGNANPVDVRLGLSLGAYEIVRRYCPIVCLGAGKNLSVASSPTGPTALAAQLNSTLFGMRMYSDLILYPGEYLSPTFYHAGQISTLAASVRVIVRGRAIPAGTRRISLPFVSHWVGALQAMGANLTEETTQQHIFNPYDTPLYCDKMIGGIACPAVSAFNYGFYQHPACMDAALNYAQIRMADGNGAPIIRDYTPFGHIFQLQDYCWNVKGAVMPGRGFWKAYFNENYASITCGRTLPSLQLMMALIAHQMVSG